MQFKYQTCAKTHANNITVRYTCPIHTQTYTHHECALSLPLCYPTPLFLQSSLPSQGMCAHDARALSLIHTYIHTYIHIYRERELQNLSPAEDMFAHET
jgi:hypothetical protein